MYVKHERPDLPMPKSKSLSARIRWLMDVHGDTEVTLEGEIGVTRKAISEHKNGHRLPTVPVLLRYADYYGVSTDWLLGRTDRQN